MKFENKKIITLSREEQKTIYHLTNILDELEETIGRDEIYDFLFQIASQEKDINLYKNYYNYDNISEDIMIVFE